MSLLSRQSRTLPGVTGVARVSRRSDTLLSRLSDGDIAVLDHLDIDRATADSLVKADVAAVINASPSISGRYPNLGPEILVGSGIILLDDVGQDVFGKIKDGAKIRIDGATVYSGTDEIATGQLQTAESVADLMIESKSGMSAQLEAFAANAIEYMKRERQLLLDGIGIPGVSIPLAGRQVVLVADAPETKAELKKLRRYISEFKPVLVGIDGGADAIRRAGYKPALIIGNPDLIEQGSLRSGADVVLPADIDGHAPGLERLQDLGVGAVTFPATGTTEDLALLLVDAHEAKLIITVGIRATLTDLLDRGRGSAASTFLVHMRVANKMVPAAAVAQLYKARISFWVVLLLIIAAVAAIVAALAVSDASGTYVDLARGWWDQFVNWVKGLF